MIAEDNPFYCKGLEEALGDLPGVSVTGTASNGEEIIRLVQANPPRIVFMDIRMPVLDGIDATRLLHQQHPEVAVVALTMHDDNHYLVQMLGAGAKGFMSKNCTEDELARAVSDVLEGTFYYCAKTRQRMTQMLTDSHLPMLFSWDKEVLLTEKEIQIIQLTCDGVPAKKIADIMDFAEDTVKKYRKSIVEKVGAKSWIGVVLYAVKKNLIN
jgi:DNA-binding NarL/FixJ family response regulator